MLSRSFERFAGVCAILAGISGFLYSLAFIVIARSNAELGGLLSAFFLMLGGLLTTAVFTALYQRLRVTDESFALWALLLGTAGALGATLHGGYDLANAINRPDSISTNLANLPNQVDPRGLLTFGLAGLALFVVAWLIARGGLLPRELGLLGYLLAVLLIIIYLGRLIILDATNPFIVIPALLVGFVLNPLWYLWLGRNLWRVQS
jgi:hypothetical protein